MYNKLFTKILDSSIWLEPTPTRIVWLTFIAVMDERGFAQFASAGNVAHRARVTIEEAQVAISSFEGPDPESSDPENDGRRLERVPGGWLVLNAEKHRAMVTKAIIQEQTRLRVQKHRDKKRSSNAPVTPSEAIAEAIAVAKERSDPGSLNQQAISLPPNGNGHGGARALVGGEISERAGNLVRRFDELFQEHRKGAKHKSRPAIDWNEACDLCRTWGDDKRLEKLAILVLTTDDAFISNTDRSFKIFALKASWADDKLRQWEIKQGIAQ